MARHGFPTSYQSVGIPALLRSGKMLYHGISSLEPRMPEPTDQFKRTPRRKPTKGKHVTLSAEAKKAYAELIEERVKREEAYGRHLPGNDKAR